jgi:hypothetical protein
MVLYAYVLCLRILASSRIPRYDLGTQTPHFEGVSITVGYHSKIGVKHILRHLKITTTLLERNG